MGRIVVGVDGSPSSSRALHWALDEARRRGDTLEVIHAWTAPPMAFTGTAAVTSMYTFDETSIMRSLEEALEGWVPRVDDVDVVREVRRGSGAEVLVAASEGAELLVVGSRGMGHLKGALLGSVSQRCAQLARCPVVIVRAVDDDD